MLALVLCGVSGALQRPPQIGTHPLLSEVYGEMSMLQRTGRGLCRVHPRVREGLPLTLGS